MVRNHMATKGEVTKENILEIAQSIMLQKGFSGTSIDEIIAAANITKGGFFYHFESKNDLAKHLMLKYQRDDDIFFQGLFSRADHFCPDQLLQQSANVFLMRLQIFIRRSACAG